MNAADVAVLLGLVLFSVRGYRTGFVNELLSLAAALVALAAAFRWTGAMVPRVADGVEASGVTIREVDITSQRVFVEAHARPTTEAALAQRYGVRMVPVILLVDGAARPLGEPIVGLDRSGFFEARVQGAIDAARHALAVR